MKNIHAISDKVLNEQIKQCHRILKDGADEVTFEMAEKALPMLRQERNRRDTIATYEKWLMPSISKEK